MKSKYILIVAFIMAIITTVLFRQYLVSMDQKYKDAEKIISIVVSKQDIKKNQLVTKDMLELKDFSSSSVHPQALKKIEDVTGKYAVTDIKAGEVLLPVRFTSTSDESTEITRKIKPGMRATSVAVSDVKAVAKLIKPEDYVDVYVCDKESKITARILENVRVLAVDKSLSGTSTVAASNSTNNNPSSNSGTVTLEVSPEDATKIIAADDLGDVRFALRGQLAQ